LSSPDRASLAASNVPRELLILLSSGLFEAGKTAQRIDAPVGKLADWCCECAIKEPGSLEQIISLGMAADTIVTLSEALANVGQHARLCRDWKREVGDLAFDFVLAGRRAELVASAVSLSRSGDFSALTPPDVSHED
jgi:hypothetical protein